MAQVVAYETKAGKRYRVRYRTPENRQTDKRGFRRKRDAEQFANTVEVAKLKGEYVSPADARRTVDSLGPSWLERQRGHLKPSAYKPLEVAWRTRVQPRWGAMSLGDVRPSEIQTWLVELGQGTEYNKAVGATVVIRTHQVFSAILADAVRDRLLARNPAQGMKLPRKTRKRPVYLNHQQVADLAAAAGEHHALVLLLAYTGLRWGEATGLRVRDLDMLRKRALITENAVQVGSAIHVGTLKSYKHRSVPLPAFLLPHLAMVCEGKGREDLLFPDDDGEHLERSHTESGWFDKSVTAAGVPRVTPHDLRHTAASLAVSAGANVKAIQRMLGHASAAMTLDVYADLFDDDLEAVATALDKARSISVGS
ncbi:site-specific integrase [soil metagenome]